LLPVDALSLDELDCDVSILMRAFVWFTTSEVILGVGVGLGVGEVGENRKAEDESRKGNASHRGFSREPLLQKRRVCFISPCVSPRIAEV